MKFEKYHGIGNDFIIIDYKSLPSKVNLKKLAIQLCNRFTGIGADGLVIAGDSNNKYRMTFYDPSGFRDSMCGNAIRCLCMYYVNNGYKKSEIEILTDDGIKKLKIVSKNPFIVKVNMQSYTFKPTEIPVITKKEKVLNEQFKLDNGEIIEYTAVKFGPAHVVIFLKEVNNNIVNNIVEQLNKPKLFPEEACFNFAKIKDKNNIFLTTWERGIGITLACGTGSCATAAIAMLNKLTNDKVHVHQKLGKLTISKEIENNEEIYFMEGPAEFVYKGILNKK